MVVNLHDDAGNAPDTVDGSRSRITGLLRELIELTGDDERAVPVLELQFGDVLTRTALHTRDQDYLVITAILPKCGDSGYVCARSDGAPAPHDTEFLWDADEGRYIGLRMVPIASLPDERSVMDAILMTSDKAAAWMAARRHEAAEG